MIDDYLARNKGVIIKSLSKDIFDKDTLTTMINMEKNGKKRMGVIKALELKKSRCE